MLDSVRPEESLSRPQEGARLEAGFGGATGGSRDHGEPGRGGLFLAVAYPGRAFDYRHSRKVGVGCEARPRVRSVVEAL